MSLRIRPILGVILAAIAVSGCVTATPVVGVETTASIAPLATRAPDEPKDDVTLGKEHFRARNYGLAEMHFRRAVETGKNDPEAWLGLGASYDKLKRFKLADRAYAQVVVISGLTPELLNNRGYSYLMRGDLRRASQDLSAAQALDPDNELILNNLRTLDGRARGRL